MDITASLAAQSYARARPATQPQEGGIGALVGDFARTLAQGEQTATAVMTGGAEPQALVQALSASELAVETVVTVRDKVVEAYQDILRMQV
ncbi:flagellar hook-basal body complex protein FliE [Falsirhodobacter algicola]|uniref:Flagellar hook-basal body complex protein FliE n=1 Tax=Falsirhodobacter algicola TaxID=2692330 RepID=A0A8J8MTA7_9RHOB|nr:flagellar hook-basal body complex protein FliE [Falsirhodobacter algicola]QUS35933.1 flagellar hook-basal body complex protein FliE [Falsirhodobacter algicola]